MYAIEYTHEPIKFKLRPTSRPVRSLREEMIEAAKITATHTNKPIYVYSSGGVDSEATCEAFKAAKIPFTVVTFRMINGNNNDHDIKYAIEWCKNNLISHTIKDFDVQKFINIDIPAFIKNNNFKFRGILPYMILEYIKLTESFNGFAVITAGDTLYRIFPGGGKFVNDSHMRPYSIDSRLLLKYMTDNNLNHNIYFLWTTSELISCLLNHPIQQFFYSHQQGPANYLLNCTQLHPACWQLTHWIKRTIYNSEFPTIIPRPKYTGYEHICPDLLATYDQYSGYQHMDTQIHNYSYADAILDLK